MLKEGLLKKCINIFPIIAIFAFAVLYFTLSYYNRWASDDFSYSSIIRMHGSVWKATVFFYYNWSSGFIANLFYFIVNYLTSFSKYVGWYNVSILLFFNLSVYLLLKEIIVLKSMYVYAIISALISAVFFYSSLNITENWFWVIGSNAYQVPISLLNFGGYFLLRYYNDNRRSDFYLACVCVFICSQFYVNYSCVLFLILFIFMFYYWLAYKKVDINIVVLLFICIVGVVIFATAPGNFVRLHAEHKLKGATSAIFPLSLQIKIALKAWIDHILKGKLPYLTVFLIPAAVLISTNFEKFRNPRFKIDIRTIAILLIGVVTMAFIINGSIMYLAIKWVNGSERSYLLIMWLLIVSLLVALSVILYKIKYNTRPILIAHFLAIAFFSYYSLKTCYLQLPIVEKYSQAEDKRIEFIKKLAHDGTSGAITLDSLPKSGLLMSAEISKDTLDYVNFDMKNCFGLQCVIKI